MARVNNFLSMMLNILKLLSLSYEQQKDALPDYVYLPDELVLSFDEVYILFDQVIDANLVNEQQIEKIAEINKAFEFMEEHKQTENPWTYEAVESGENWKNIRKLSREALALFSEKEDRLDLSWVTYVGSKKDERKTK
jgi:hypothetical protein